MKPDAPAPVMLYDAGLSPVFRLEYSPDGKLLAAPVATDDGVTVNILNSEGAAVTSFHSPTLGAAAPVWTPDGKEVVLFDKNLSGYVRVELANPSHRRLIVPFPRGGIVFHNGGTFAGMFNKTGYWRIDGALRQVTNKWPLNWTETPSFLADDLLVPDFTAAGGPRILAQPLAGGPDRVLAYAPGAQAREDMVESKIVANPKTGEIIYVAAVQSDTNIDLLTLARR